MHSFGVTALRGPECPLKGICLMLTEDGLFLLLGRVLISFHCFAHISPLISNYIRSLCGGGGGEKSIPVNHCSQNKLVVMFKFSIQSVHSAFRICLNLLLHSHKAQFTPYSTV